MGNFRVPVSFDVHLDWEYGSAHSRILRLRDDGARLVWREDVDIDWTLQELAPPGSSALDRRVFESSPLHRYGERTWREFLQDQQAWMVGQFLHGEQSALIISARLAEMLPDVGSKTYAAIQAAEEARHVSVFLRYTNERVTNPYPVAPSFERLLAQVLSERRWDMLVLGLHVMIEALALGAFRLASTTFADPLLRRITSLAARDEARHVSFGILLLESAFASMTEAERREREQFVLEAAELLSRRYMLTEVWKRLGIPISEGTAFVRSDDVMQGYKRTIFGRVVHALTQIGLMTPRVRRGLDRLGLLSAAAR